MGALNDRVHISSHFKTDSKKVDFAFKIHILKSGSITFKTWCHDGRQNGTQHHQCAQCRITAAIVPSVTPKALKQTDKSMRNSNLAKHK